MKSIYFVRHGESEWNITRQICGATDKPLTEKGRSQARHTAENIIEQNIKADMILYSPLSRAKDTALTISEITGIPAREEIRLKEHNFGYFEGKSYDVEGFMEAKTRMADSYETGESMFRLAQRVYNLLDELKEDDKTYILVAHNGIVRVIPSYFFDMTNEEFAKFAVKNCSVTEYQYK